MERVQGAEGVGGTRLDQNAELRAQKIVGDEVVEVALNVHPGLVALRNFVRWYFVTIRSNGDAIENQRIEDAVPVDHRVRTVSEDAHLIRAHVILQHTNIVRAKDQNAGASGGAIRNRNGWEPHIVPRVFRPNQAGGAETDLDSVLRRAGGGPDSRDEIRTDG